MNIYNNLRYLPLIIMLLIMSGILYSCANMSRPGGGPKDEIPPKYIKSNPLPDTRNYNEKRIEIEFDEIIQVDKPSEKVIISPPQLNMPKIQAQGRKVRIELQDSLLPNTTYTIDFSNAIVDNNEKNALEGFSFSFSTGQERDSLQISGILLNAEDLEPITGMLVGAYSNLHDSAFTTIPMERIAASDARGHFTIRNLKPGQYRIVALKDGNRNYRFDSNTEDIAFSDSIFTPYSLPKQYADTIYTDSATIDSIHYIDYNQFFPNNVLLTAFNEQIKRQYLQDNQRKERNRLDFTFAAPQDSLPVISLLDTTAHDQWYVLEKNITNDTLYYWIKDSTVFRSDTLKVALSYYRTDSLEALSLYNDTLTMTYRAPKENKKKKKRASNDSLPEVIPTVFAPMEIGINGKHEVNRPIVISFKTPIDSLYASAFHLYEKSDTTWTPLPDSLYTLAPDSISLRNYLLSHRWKPEGKYRLEVDSMAVIDMYGLHTDKFNRDFDIKSMQEYTNLYFSLIGVNDSAVVQLLNNSDKPVYQVPVKDGGAEFTYLKPGTYYARLFIDSNNNGKYDTGNYAQQRQPEEVYYYPGELELRAYWNVEQDWDIYKTAIDKQKPLAIKRNKSKEEMPKKEDEEDNDNDYDNNYNRNNNYNSGSRYGSGGYGPGNSSPGAFSGSARPLN